MAHLHHGNNFYVREGYGKAQWGGSPFYIREGYGKAQGGGRGELLGRCVLVVVGWCASGKVWGGACFLEGVCSSLFRGGGGCPYIACSLLGRAIDRDNELRSGGSLLPAEE